MKELLQGLLARIERGFDADGDAALIERAKEVSGHLESYASEDADTRALLEADDRDELVSIGDAATKAIFSSRPEGEALADAETKKFACPECGSVEHSYGHLKAGQTFGPWYCDKCGTSVNGEVTADGVKTKLGEDVKFNTLVLLRLDVPGTEAEPVHIVVRGMGFHKRGEQPSIEPGRDEYFYNEHTCPWNYLRLPIKCGDDTDPHGLFVHQETILMPEWYDDHLDNIETWQELFPSLLSAPAAAEGVPDGKPCLCSLHDRAFSKNADVCKLRLAIDEGRESSLALLNRAVAAENELARLRTQSPAHSEHSLAMVGAQAGGVPAGFVIVPIEPTGVMKDAGAGSLPIGAGPWHAGDCYRAMLAYAPAAPVAADERAIGLERVIYNAKENLRAYVVTDPDSVLGRIVGNVISSLDAALAARKADGKGGAQS